MRNVPTKEMSTRGTVVVATLVFVATVATAELHAYLDPGSGGLLIQLLLALTSVVALTGKIFWSKIRTLVSRIVGRGGSNAD